MTRQRFLRLLDRVERALPQACRSQLQRLERRRRTPFLKVLVGGILSHQTTARQERTALQRLWTYYDSTEKVARTHPRQIEALIGNVGLGRVKAARIVAIARLIKLQWRREQRLVNFLRTAPLAEAQRVLLELPGVGPKTAAVVLLFRFNRSMFPVDTNILRVARELGWVRRKADAEDVRAFVERILPPDPRIYKKAHAYLLVLGRATQRGRNRRLLERLRAS